MAMAFCAFMTAMAEAAHEDAGKHQQAHALPVGDGAEESDGRQDSVPQQHDHISKDQGQRDRQQHAKAKMNKQRAQDSAAGQSASLPIRAIIEAMGASVPTY